MIGPTLRIGHMVCGTSRLPSIQLPLYPILGNLGFPPGAVTGSFSSILERGFFQASHFLETESWPTTVMLTHPEGRYRLRLWQALQLGHFFRSLGPPGNYRRLQTQYETYCEKGEPLGNTLSKIHSLLVAPPEDFWLPSLSKWEKT